MHEKTTPYIGKSEAKLTFELCDFFFNVLYFKNFFLHCTIALYVKFTFELLLQVVLKKRQRPTTYKWIGRPGFRRSGWSRGLVMLAITNR